MRIVLILIGAAAVAYFLAKGIAAFRAERPTKITHRKDNE